MHFLINNFYSSKYLILIDLHSLYFQGYFNSLLTEKMGQNIDMTLLCPGPVKTNFLQECFTEKTGEVRLQPILKYI